MTSPRVTPPTLDHFEDGLLQELRAHVATRAPEAAVEPEARRSHRRRWVAGFAVAAATATAFVVASPGGPATSPAYAISQESDGDVVVTIHRLEDSAGLEAALAEHGIDADVSFRPAPVEDENGITTYTFPDDPSEGAPGGGEPSYNVESEPKSGSSRVDQAQEPADGQGPDLPDCGTRGNSEPATLTHEGDDWVLRIPADSPAQDRHIEISTMSDGALMVGFEGNDPNSICYFMSVGEQG